MQEFVRKMKMGIYFGAISAAVISSGWKNDITEDNRIRKCSRTEE